MVARLTVLNSDAGMDRRSAGVSARIFPAARFLSAICCVVSAADAVPAVCAGAGAGFDGVDEDGEGVTSGEEEPPPPELFAVGVTAFDALDETEFPRAFVATAVKV